MSSLGDGTKWPNCQNETHFEKVEELSNENLYRILVRRSNVTDLEVNTLVWKCLGYRFDSTTEEWTATEVFPKWKERFPTPPDLIGMQRIYSKDVDGPSLKNNQHLVLLSILRFLRHHCHKQKP